MRARPQPAAAPPPAPVRGCSSSWSVAGAWYAAAAAQAGRAFLTIVANENLVRIVGAKSASLGHVHGFAYLVGALLAGLLPWTLLLPSTALALWRDRATIDRRDPAPVRDAVELRRLPRRSPSPAASAASTCCPSTPPWRC